jgi:hypothetical protein
MLKHIGLAAAVVALIAISTENVHARGGGHGRHGGFARSFAPNYATPSYSPGTGMSNPSTSRRAARTAKKNSAAAASTSSAASTNSSGATNSTGSTSSTTSGSSKRNSSRKTAGASTNTPASTTNASLQTPAVGTVGVSPLGLLSYGNSLDPNTSAQRTYGYLLRNARYLIQAGLYAPAANYLQRIIAGAPGTRIANEARQLLARLPVI